MKESDLAAMVVAWLVGNDWDIYQEVTMSEGVADIVAVRNKRVWVIETKLQFGLNLISQGVRWKRYAHWVSLCCPPVYSKANHEKSFGLRICQDYGLGLIFVPERRPIVERIAAPLNRRALSGKVLSVLCDGHKSSAMAGVQGGGRWTPFSETCRKVRDYVKSNQGCRIGELIDKVGTHYATKVNARSALYHWITFGKIDGVTAIKEGRALRLYAR